MSEEEEKIKLSIVASYDNRGNIDKNKLIENLTEINASVEGSDFPFLVTLNKSNYTIYSNSKINKVSEDALNAKKICGIMSSSTITENEKADFYREFYGKTVDYPVEITTFLTRSIGKNGKWKIFYADENNIYLIADSRVEVPYNSEETSENSFLSGYITTNQWSATFGTVRTYDNGIFPSYLITNLDYNRTSPTHITKYASEETLKKLNDSYYNQGFIVQKEKEGLSSLRAVISMLDTDVWSVYKDSDYAQYAIGGPSIEMFCKSYSQTHEQRIETKAFAKQSGIADQYGYKIKIAGADDYDFALANWTILSDLNQLYFGNEMYWFCSPSAQTSYTSIMHMGTYGAVNSIYGDIPNNNAYDTGFRPVVCLKTNVQLEKNTDEKFDYVVK